MIASLGCQEIPGGHLRCSTGTNRCRCLFHTWDRESCLFWGTGNRRRSWDQRETNWHRMTVQLPPFKGGLGLTPQVLLASLLSTLARALSLDGWRNAHTCATGSDNLSMPEQLVDA